SQERMLLVAEKGREHEVLSVFDKWGLEGVTVGTVISEQRLRILHHGELVADIPNQSLTDDCPIYSRPVGTWARPDQIKVPLDPPPHILEELKKPRDYTADLKKLLASANICSKRWVYEQYDSMVQTNTVQGPGGEAGVMRIKGTGTPGHERGLAMALAGNGRWCYLDPKLGAMHAVAEAARKVACTGATPVAATNCLNFGNPEKPEIMAQLSAAIDGIAEACTALGTPITGGNVSLYNETKGEGIYPTPVVGVVGILDDVTKAVPSSFQREGERIFLLGPRPPLANTEEAEQVFGSSEYAKTVLGEFWGRPAALCPADEAALHRCLAELATKELLQSASDLSDGGLAIALAKGAFENHIGVKVELSDPCESPLGYGVFQEPATHVIVTVTEINSERVRRVVAGYEQLFAAEIGRTVTKKFDLHLNGGKVIATTVPDLEAAFSTALESQLSAEVTA
ncbi:MAG: AIR synthase related protein, partial [Acidobacteriaceae bacterium]